MHGNKGKKHTEEHKRKIMEKSPFQKGHQINLGKKRLETTKKKIGLANKGKKRTDKIKKEISEERKERFKNPANCPNWQGGISFESYPLNWTKKLKEAIRERDNYICFVCEEHQSELKQKLSVHHIDYNKDNLDPKNLISLCRVCHIKTNYNRNYWIKYFNDELL